MNNRQKWQARKNEIKTKCSKMLKTEIVKWFHQDTDDTCVRIAIYQYLYETYEHPFT